MAINPRLHNPNPDTVQVWVSFSKNSRTILVWISCQGELHCEVSQFIPEGDNKP